MRLTTAEITYRMPDFRDIMQIYIWQDYDLAPRFPKLIKFLDFWSHNLDGPLPPSGWRKPGSWRRRGCATSEPSGACTDPRIKSGDGMPKIYFPRPLDTFLL